MTTEPSTCHDRAADEAAESDGTAPERVEYAPARTAAISTAIDLVAWVALAVFTVTSVNTWNLSPWLLIVAGIGISGAAVAAEQFGAILAEVRHARNRVEGASRR